MIPLSHLIDRYQKDLESIHGHEMLPSHHQALKAVITWCSNANPVQPQSEFLILVVIGVALTANIMTANNGFSGRLPNCCRPPIS